jgi:hypothetical protein
MNYKRTVIFFFLAFIFNSSLLCGQCISCGQFEKDLIKLSSKVSNLRFDYGDSLEFYSEQFSKRLKTFIKNNPLSLDYKFQALVDSGVCFIKTSDDGLFRIYSWDDEMGGTMRFFKTIFQFKSGGQVFTKTNETEVEDTPPASFYSQIFSLLSNNTKYYLAVDNGIYSSKDASQSISIFTIKDGILNDTAKLIKTTSRLTNRISISFDFFTVADRHERPLELIKYDEIKKIIYIPIVLENGKVTDRFILYQFKGQYFEKILTQKVADKQKN